MKTMIRCPHSGQVSSKRVLSLCFGIVSIVLAGLMPFFEFDTSIIKYFAGLSIGGQALTKNFAIGNTKIE